MLSCSFIGSPDTVRSGLEAFVAEHEPDELIVTTSAYDQAARLRSLELLAGLRVGAAVAR
jgi:alkanesulfonate monooxygenase SsuD/methylene tetrahydromethanopterin reductase-like flavin-dependent oxidoreductase (luciferase family)